MSGCRRSREPFRVDRACKVAPFPRSPSLRSGSGPLKPGLARSVHQPHTHTRQPPTIADLAAALSDTPTHETSAWLVGRVARRAVLELRLAALLPDAQPIVCSDTLAAWVTRHHSATIVYWAGDGELELTVDDDIELSIATILNDIATTDATAEPTADRPDERPLAGADTREYGDAMREPVITRVVAIEELPPGSRATRRLIAAWSDCSQSEALAWFVDLCGHPNKSAYAETRVMPRDSQHRRGGGGDELETSA